MNILPTGKVFRYVLVVSKFTRIAAKREEIVTFIIHYQASIL